MNKRAFSAMIVIMIVALFVLGLVTLAIGTKFHPSASTFIQSIISFGNDNSTTRSLEALRYNITSDTLSYYTGSDFAVIAPGTHVLLNDKYIESDLIRKAITDYYFDLDARLFYASGDPTTTGKNPSYRFSLAPNHALTASIVSFSSATRLIEAPSSLWDQFYLFGGETVDYRDIFSPTKQSSFFGNTAFIQLPRRGDVVLLITNYTVRETAQGTTIKPTLIGEALVRTTNEFDFVPHKDFEDFSLANEEKQDLLRQVITWRDSLFKGGSLETTLDVPFRKKVASDPLTFVTVQPERDPLTGDIILRLDKEVVRKNAGGRTF